uniref:hypothetical protein n=1 Tax=Escherichia coli TaxID=562 RepID=UPI001FCF1E36
VSIKNDGHYFCRAGGNRPDGLNEPVTKELDNAINKIIVTSLFSCLSDTQQKQFYESAFNMIERCCFCDADELPEKIRKQLADALRVRLSDQFSEMYSPNLDK